MRTETAPSFPISIFIAGDYDEARDACQAHCDEVGLCVTVTRTTYIYTDGEQEGVIVGFINYPRFPTEPALIEAKAIELGTKLRVALGQESFSVQTPTTTTWFSWRPDDRPNPIRRGQVMDEQMIELIARAMKPELFEGGPDETRGPATRYERDFARKMARAAHSVMAGKVAELTEANAKLRRCLGPVVMTLAQAECIDEPIPDDAVVLHFMGSGASDQVTAGEVRAALAPYPERRSEHHE